MTNLENLKIMSKAAANCLPHNSERMVIEMLIEWYNASIPQAVEAIKIAKGIVKL